MSQSGQQSLLLKPRQSSQMYQFITPSSAGWSTLHFAAVRLRGSERFEHATGDSECVLVVLGGTCSVQSSAGTWTTVGRRPNVFAGMPHALYIPPRTELVATAVSPELDFALGWCPAERSGGAQLITPDTVGVEIRGGGNATRQINSIIPPSGPGQRLVVVEVYTPAGNWSSYPPHKHDRHRLDDAGHLIEAELEEIYFYKTERPEGFALQRVYSDDRSLDQTLTARNDDVVLVPRGYHPVAAAPGSSVYYLNILAGSAKSLASTDDPAYAWIKSSWPPPDPRVPVVRMDMERTHP